MGAQPISVIIPHLNQPQALDKCLSSLVDQVRKLPGSEIIVVDNGSHEMPTGICSRYEYVRLLQQRIPGPGPARNYGIAAANSDLLAFIDADCTAGKDWLSVVYNSFISNGSRQAIGGDVRIGYADAHCLTKLEAYESVFAYRQKEYILRKHFSGTGNLAMRRSVYDLVGPFAGIGIAEDVDWGRRARAKDVVIDYIPQAIIYHPARQTMIELQHKWDRHIHHNFNLINGSWTGKTKWAATAFAVGLSGLFDIWRIFSSDRLHKFSDRRCACEILVRIRIYRALRMIALLRTSPGATNPKWNRN